MFLRAYKVVLHEAWRLQEAVKFLEEDNWSACFKDWKNLAVMVRLAPGGSVKVIAGDQKLGTCAQRDEFKDGPEGARVPLERSRNCER